MWSGPNYAYFHSGHRGGSNMCDNLALKSILRDITQLRDSIYTTGLPESPDAIITFVFKNVRTSDFMRYAGSFSSRDNSNDDDIALRNLKLYTEERSGSLLTFSNCALSHKSIPSSTRDAAQWITGDEQITALINSGSSLNNLKNNRNLVIVFDAVRIGAEDELAQVKKIDSQLGAIVQRVSDLTAGNYVAVLMADNSQLAIASRGATTASTSKRAAHISMEMQQQVAADEPIEFVDTELYIDAQVVSGLIVGGMFLALVAMVLYLLHRINPSPHLTDAFEGEEQRKKMQ